MYEVKTDSRNWLTYIFCFVVFALGVWLSVLYSPWFLFLFGLPLAWACYCIIQNRQWYFRVNDGAICWNSHFLGRQTAIAIDEITKIRIREGVEGEIYFDLTLQSGKKKSLHACHKGGQFRPLLSAILSEKPGINVEFP